jgi:hypothetical protein
VNTALWCEEYLLPVGFQRRIQYIGIYVMRIMENKTSLKLTEFEASGIETEA